MKVGLEYESRRPLKAARRTTWTATREESGRFDSQRAAAAIDETATALLLLRKRKAAKDHKFSGTILEIGIRNGGTRGGLV